MLKKYIAAIVAVIIWISCLSTVTFAEDNNVIKVGFPESYGFSTITDGGVYGGLIHDYLTEIAKYTGWKYEFISGSTSAIYDKLLAGEVDIMGAMLYDESLEESITYAQYGSGFASSTINVLSDNTTIIKSDYKTFKNMKIGVWENAKQTTADMVKFLDTNSIDYTLVTFAKIADIRTALKNKEIDAILSRDTLEHGGQRIVASFAPMPYYFAVANGNPDIVSKLNMALDKIKSVEPNYDNILHRKHFHTQSDRELFLTQDELEYIATTPPIKVALNPNLSPLQSFDENKDPNGISIDFLESISSLTGLKFEYVETLTYADTVRVAEQGQVDMVASININGTSSKRGELVTTRPFLPINRVIIENVSTSGIDRQNARVATTNEYEFAQSGQNIIPIYYDTVETCLQSVEDGETDYAVTSDYVINAYIKENPKKNLQTRLVVGANDSLCYGLVRPANPELLTILNKAIASIPPAEVDNLVFENTKGQSNNGGFLHYMDENPFVGASFAAASIIILAILVFLIMLVRLRHNRKMYELLSFDEVTGSMSYARFKVEALQLIRTNTSYVMISMDIDKFKIINDMFGYEKGNKVLKTLGAYIDEALSENEIYSRVNADNFNLLVEYVTDEDIIIVINALSEKMASCIDGYHIEMSFGIYKITEAVRDITVIVDRASLAKHTIKDDADVNYTFFDENIRSRILKEKEIENVMEEALEMGEFELYLQPKYSFDDEVIVGAEALVRWNSKAKGMIYPDSFIPIFERNGFIRKLDKYMFEHTVEFLLELNRTQPGHEELVISVNFSRMHLNNQNLAAELLEVAEKYGIRPQCVEIELTETAAFENVDRLIKTMTSLKNAGFLLSIDDFGAGFSSLNTLKDLPADVIKFDRGFLQESSNSSRGKRIIQSLISMTTTLGLSTVAEGVETKEQADFLRGCGCDVAQGYYYSKPIPAFEFAVLVEMEQANQ